MIRPGIIHKSYAETHFEKEGQNEKSIVHSSFVSERMEIEPQIVVPIKSKEQLDAEALDLEIITLIKTLATK